MAKEEVNGGVSAPLRDSSKDSGYASDENPQDNVAAGKHKRIGALVSSCVSAQDAEKERQENSSPRGVLEFCMLSSEPDKNSSSEDVHEGSEFTCRDSAVLLNWSKFFKGWGKKSFKRFASFPPLGVSMSKRKGSSTKDDNELSDLYTFQSSLRNFTLSELLDATHNFNPENIIGRGGYADVYQGCLTEGKLIAVKRLTKGTQDERTASFLSELGIIAHLNHPNTAKLIGCCTEGGMHLVFELSPLGSLGSLLHGPSKSKLEWSRRYKIALGTADGLMYLHENCQRRIIHRDIKAENILLTVDFEPQICDFGLAKWLPKQWTHHNVSKFEGTFGYFAPEYFMHGIVDEKTDVYSFGVLLLELITGRPALDNLQQNLVLWAKPLLENSNIKELVDPSLGDKYDPEEVDRVALTASMCIDQSSILRPRMSQIVVLLRGNEYVAECSKEKQTRRPQRTYSEERLDAQEYNSTRYLKDL